MEELNVGCWLVACTVEKRERASVYEKADDEIDIVKLTTTTAEMIYKNESSEKVQLLILLRACTKTMSVVATLLLRRLI